MTGEGASQPLKRVIFVDDDRDILDSIRDALRPYRHVWRMRFAISGAAALAALEQEPADVIVSDIQMPGMDGAVLLARVQERYPATIRLVLSGYANPVVDGACLDGGASDPRQAVRCGRAGDRG